MTAAASEAGVFDEAAAEVLLAKVYKAAPDCIPAQLTEAKLMMAQRKYEEVGGGCH